MTKFDEWWDSKMGSKMSGSRYLAKKAWDAALAEAIKVMRNYKVSVGNSAAGEIACEMTLDNLREIVAELESEVKG